MSVIPEFQRVCIQAARAGGAVLEDWAGRFKVQEKGPADLVTEADLASQERVREVLLGAFPNHGFLAEENLVIPPGADGYRWIVDPLDGTTNYVHGLANYAVSIALTQHGQPLVGVVFDPRSGECFHAGRGLGAWVNERRLSVSTVESLDEALVANSFAARVGKEDREVAEFLDVLLVAQATRRMGSSALNLAYLAAGRFDAYWATSTKAWDIAAGVLLVQEAGGIITNAHGDGVDLERPAFIAAATPALHAELSALLGRSRLPAATATAASLL